jgi:hypothetical protein
MAFYTSTPEVPAIILYTKFQRENQAKNARLFGPYNDCCPKYLLPLRAFSAVACVFLHLKLLAEDNSFDPRQLPFVKK